MALRKKQIDYLANIFEGKAKTFSPAKLFNTLADGGMSVEQHQSLLTLTLTSGSCLTFTTKNKKLWATHRISSDLKDDIKRVLVNAGYRPEYIDQKCPRNVPAPNN